ncbi:MAG: ATP-binding protein [Acidobacteriota bacterium]|nr:MAG: ATP-binding protein [Acidobacteriota bacterium]
MIIAISGAHGTGKSTLAEALADRLEGFVLVEEPYWQLVEEGHAFSQPPTVNDFEAQLDRSIASILASEGDVIFERCPLDFLGYLAVHSDVLTFDPETRIDEVCKAMELIDLIVFVPVEDPDRIPDVECASMRRRVDEELRELVMEDRLDLGLNAIEVFGSPEQRATMVELELRNLQ